jgi:hypothetical protein
MAAPRIIEQDFGIWSEQIHPHNGYYSGNHSVAQHQSQRATHEQLQRWATEMTTPGRFRRDTTDLASHATMHTWPA